MAAPGRHHDPGTGRSSPHELPTESGPEDEGARPPSVGPEPRLLRQILEAATRAPTAYDLQPGRFLIVRDRRNRQRLHDCAYGQSVLAEAPIALIVLGYLHPHRTHLDAILGEQVQAGRLDAAGAAYRRGLVRSAMERVADPASWAGRAAAAVAMAVVAAARERGVAVAWVEGYHEERLRQAFGIPDDHAVGALLALGRAPSPGAVNHPLPLDEVCFEEHFGQPFRLNEERGPASGTGP